MTDYYDSMTDGRILVVNQLRHDRAAAQGALRQQESTRRFSPKGPMCGILDGHADASQQVTPGQTGVHAVEGFPSYADNLEHYVFFCLSAQNARDGFREFCVKSPEPAMIESGAIVGNKLGHGAFEITASHDSYIMVDAVGVAGWLKSGDFCIDIFFEHDTDDFNVLSFQGGMSIKTRRASGGQIELVFGEDEFTNIWMPEPGGVRHLALTRCGAYLSILVDGQRKDTIPYYSVPDTTDDLFVLGNTPTSTPGAGRFISMRCTAVARYPHDYAVPAVYMPYSFEIASAVSSIEDELIGANDAAFFAISDENLLTRNNASPVVGYKYYYPKESLFGKSLYSNAEIMGSAFSSAGELFTLVYAERINYDTNPFLHDFYVMKFSKNDDMPPRMLRLRTDHGFLAWGVRNEYGGGGENPVGDPVNGVGLITYGTNDLFYIGCFDNLIVCIDPELNVIWRKRAFAPSNGGVARIMAIQEYHQTSTLRVLIRCPYQYPSTLHLLELNKSTGDVVSSMTIEDGSIGHGGSSFFPSGNVHRNLPRNMEMLEVFSDYSYGRGAVSARNTGVNVEQYFEMIDWTTYEDSPAASTNNLAGWCVSSAEVRLGASSVQIKASALLRTGILQYDNGDESVIVRPMGACVDSEDERVSYSVMLTSEDDWETCQVALARKDIRNEGFDYVVRLSDYTKHYVPNRRGWEGEPISKFSGFDYTPPKILCAGDFVLCAFYASNRYITAVKINKNTGVVSSSRLFYAESANGGIFNGLANIAIDRCGDSFVISAISKATSGTYTYKGEFILHFFTVPISSDIFETDVWADGLFCITEGAPY